MVTAECGFFLTQIRNSTDYTVWHGRSPHIDLVQFVGIRIKGGKAVGYFQEIVTLLEDARSDEGRHEIFTAVLGRISVYFAVCCSQLLHLIIWPLITSFISISILEGKRKPGGISRETGTSAGENWSGRDWTEAR